MWYYIYYAYDSSTLGAGLHKILTIVSIDLKHATYRGNFGLLQISLIFLNVIPQKILGFIENPKSTIKDIFSMEKTIIGKVIIY